MPRRHPPSPWCATRVAAVLATRHCPSVHSRDVACAPTVRALAGSTRDPAVHTRPLAQPTLHALVHAPELSLRAGVLVWRLRLPLNMAAGDTPSAYAALDCVDNATRAFLLRLLVSCAQSSGPMRSRTRTRRLTGHGRNRRRASRTKRLRRTLSDQRTRRSILRPNRQRNRRSSTMFAGSVPNCRSRAGIPGFALSARSAGARWSTVRCGAGSGSTNACASLRIREHAHAEQRDRYGRTAGAGPRPGNVLAADHPLVSVRVGLSRSADATATWKSRRSTRSQHPTRRSSFKSCGSTAFARASSSTQAVGRATTFSASFAPTAGFARWPTG